MDHLVSKKKILKRHQKFTFFNFFLNFIAVPLARVHTNKQTHNYGNLLTTIKEEQIEKSTIDHFSALKNSSIRKFMLKKIRLTFSELRFFLFQVLN
jgi:hypothetical protein